jgi:hypothetical protein
MKKGEGWLRSARSSANVLIFGGKSGKIYFGCEKYLINWRNYPI